MADYGIDVLFDLKKDDNKHVSPMLLIEQTQSLTRDYIKKTYKENDIKLYEDRVTKINSIYSQACREVDNLQVSLRESSFDPDGVSIYARLNFAAFLPEKYKEHGGGQRSFMGKQGEDRICPPHEYKTMTFNVNSPDHELSERTLTISMESLHIGDDLMEKIAIELSKKYELKTYVREVMGEDYIPLNEFIEKQTQKKELTQNNQNRSRRRP